MINTELVGALATIHPDCIFKVSFMLKTRDFRLRNQGSCQTLQWMHFWNTRFKAKFCSYLLSTCACQNLQVLKVGNPSACQENDKEKQIITAFTQNLNLCSHFHSNVMLFFSSFWGAVNLRRGGKMIWLKNSIFCLLLIMVVNILI